MRELMTGPGVIVALPILLAIIAAAAGRRYIGFNQYLVMLGPLAVVIVGLQHLADARTAGGFAPLTGAATSFAWLAQGGATITAGISVDNLTAVMLVVVGVVALMVMLFSVGYMAEDPARARYFGLLSLFTASMTLLVVADTLPLLFVGWELVGACSYLLIGFWFRKASAARAAMKAFLTTRVGDVGILLALALLWRETGTMSIPGVMQAVPGLSAGVVTTAALLVFLGAAGKSAQFPLHIWLPDAMEGPTPVSALIHAATMVASGVYLIARTWPLFEASPLALHVILAVGTFTALFAASIALVQTDIKKVLAYSTISQLGFMFAALGAGAWVAAMFHLVTHAAFKGLLFLASGSVIHGSGTQDLRKMGGLSSAMPVTTVTWFVGVLALAGWWPFSGFFSKDEIITEVMHVSPVAGWVLLFAALITALYAFRATKLAFFGRFRGEGHPHESPWTMTAPLVVLAMLAASLGFTNKAFAMLMGHELPAMDLAVAALSLMAATLGTVAAFLLYVRGAERIAWARERFPRTVSFVFDGYRVDSLVEIVIIRPLKAVASWFAAIVDARVIDGAAEGVGKGGMWLGKIAASVQTGETDIYVSLMGVGFVVLMGIALWIGRG